jgi:toxin FitB
MRSEFLFDTFALSEPGKAHPHPKAVAWIKAVPFADVAVSALTVGELAFGASRLPPGAKRTRLEAWLHGELLAGNLGRIVPFNAAVALTWARIKATALETPPIMDSLIAATALTYNLTVVTRNERDFVRLGVRVINPWAP